jgi:hypothetical protein
VDGRLAASVLMSASFHRAFMEEFVGAPMELRWKQLSKQLIAAVVPQVR